MVFDNYVVVHYSDLIRKAAAVEDETSEAEEKKAREKRRDPILFGLIKNSRKLYYITDWKTDVDDLGYVLGFIIRDLDEIARTGRWRLPPLVNSDLLIRQGKKADSDLRFVRTLLETAVGNYPQYEKMIAALVSRWDSDRLYTTDVVLIALGLSEAVCFPEIPLRVTINEYVEISKFYSTPKSGSFVNGLLDRLIKQFAAEGKINKN